LFCFHKKNGGEDTVLTENLLQLFSLYLLKRIIEKIFFEYAIWLMKEFIRNFKKQKVIGLFNICSLALGIMAALTVGLWVINELSFDNFHANGDRMYRVVQEFDLNGKPVKAASSFKPLGELAEAEIPEIEQMCRIYKERDGITINESVTFSLTAIMTDYNFFSFFTFPMKEGDPEEVFNAPDNVILSESAAKRFFPNQDPIGEKISYHGYDLSVSGIMYDIPRNSHIQADIVFPLFGYFGEWGWDSSFSYDTYFIIPSNADIYSIQQRITDINTRSIAVYQQGGRNKVTLEPLSEIHFSKADSGFDSAVKGNKNLLWIFIITAIAILVIACINFTNLFISTSFIRAKSIGIKKSQGAGKLALIREFFTETAIYVCIAVLLGIFLTILCLPAFNSYAHSTVNIDFTSVEFYIFILSLTLITILMAGTFPALQMTRFGIIETLSRKFRGKRMSAFQKVLIIIQFVSSICLLIVVSFFGKQIDYILSQDLGFDNKNVICVQGWREFGEDYKSLREYFIHEPSIIDVAMKQYNLPTEIGNGISGKNIQTGEGTMLDLAEVSPNYFDFFDMQFVEGENPLTLESAAQQRYCVINESAAKALGIDNPVDQSFVFMSIGNSRMELDGKRMIIKGVVRDSYVKSLYQAPDPQLYLNLSRDDHNPIFFKIAGDPQNAVEVIENKWKEMIPDVPFEYYFLDQTYENLYVSEVSTRKVLSYALIITFIITVAGLYAMAFYSTQRRIKEIGIRKINGATITDLLVLLNKDILIWLSIAFVIAGIISYMFLKDWLGNFIIRTPLSWWIFLLAGLISAIVALLTVSYLTWKAASANPVNSIKSE